MVCLCHFLSTVWSFLFPITPPTTSSTSPIKSKPNSNSSTGVVKGKKGSYVTLIVLFLTFTVSVTLWISRIVNNNLQYGGYLTLWHDLHTHFTPASPDSPANTMNLTVCVGQEWYYFPSHFFLPPTVSLGYIEDDFHGLLPGYFEGLSSNSSVIGLGTRQIPQLTRYNDRNTEECTRYHPITSCDLLIQSSSRLNENNNTLFLSHCHDNADKEKECSSNESDHNTCQQVVEKVLPIHTVTLIPLLERAVVAGVQPGWELAKAFFIPTISVSKVNYKQYTLSFVRPESPAAPTGSVLESESATTSSQPHEEQ